MRPTLAHPYISGCILLSGVLSCSFLHHVSSGQCPSIRRTVYDYSLICVFSAASHHHAYHPKDPQRPTHTRAPLALQSHRRVAVHSRILTSSGHVLPSGMRHVVHDPHSHICASVRSPESAPSILQCYLLHISTHSRWCLYLCSTLLIFSFDLFSTCLFSVIHALTCASFSGDGISNMVLMCFILDCLISTAHACIWVPSGH